MKGLKIQREAVRQDLTLIAREFIDIYTDVVYMKKINALLEEEQVLAAEVYATVALKERYVDRFVAKDPEIVLLRSVSVLLENANIIDLRLRRPMPFALDYFPVEAISMGDDFYFQLTDFLFRKRAHSKSDPLAQDSRVSKSIFERSTQYIDKESYLNDLAAICDDYKQAVAKMRVSERALRIMLANKECVL